ncbi:MAG TPA: ROK family transcriptional regulator [Symbiobacteriaceae bacterium]|jgi:predicted NBD/HSP70 family sugar kinase
MRALVVNGPGVIRQSNRVAILRYLRAGGAVSRPQIAEAVGLSRPTVANLVDELVAEGLVREVGLGQSTRSGGKRPGLVKLNPDAAAVAAVAIGVEQVEAGIIKLDGHVARRRQAPMPAAVGPEAGLDLVRRMLSDLLTEYGREPHAPVLGVGASAPGVVHPATGVVAFSPALPGWRDVPLGPELARATGLPVTLDSECRAQTLGEVWFGQGQEVGDLVGLVTGAGIGAGVVMDGLIYRGPDDSAGEIGHTTLDPLGARCHCGNMGCWEVYSSTAGLLRMVRDALWRGEFSTLGDRVGNDLGRLTLPMVLDAVRCGDTLARRYAVDEMGYRLGVGIANLVNTFNPEMVVLFGPITALGEELLERIRTTVRTRALPQAGARARIVCSLLGADGPLVGAATLVISRLFSVAH